MPKEKSCTCTTFVVLCTCTVYIKKIFNRVPRKLLQCAVRKKGIPLVRSVMIMNEGAKTRVGVHSELSEEFEVKV